MVVIVLLFLLALLWAEVVLAFEVLFLLPGSELTELADFLFFWDRSVLVWSISSYENSSKKL